MASANNFGIEKGKGDVALKWINEYLVKNNKIFKISITSNRLDTLNFGTFDLVEWQIYQKDRMNS